MKNYLYLISIFIFLTLLVLILPEKTYGQGLPCNLRSYADSTTLTTDPVCAGQNGVPPTATTALLKNLAKAKVDQLVQTEHGTKAVECDLVCRGKVTSSSLATCKATFKEKTTISYSCNGQPMCCTASAFYEYSCNCKDAVKQEGEK